MKRYFINNGIRYLQFDTSDIRMKIVDSYKVNIHDETFFNLGFFAYYSEIYNGRKTNFTLPVGNVCMDIDENINPLVPKYLKEWSRSNSNRIELNVNQNASKQFANKNVSTLMIDEDNNVRIEAVSSVPDGTKFAVSGIPFLVKGERTNLGIIRQQGWDYGSMYRTWHGFLAINQNTSKITYFMLRNLFSYNSFIREVCNKTKNQDFTDIIMLDGGGSFIFNYRGDLIRRVNERRINNIAIIK